MGSIHNDQTMGSIHNDQTMEAAIHTLGDNAPTAVQEESRERAAYIQSIYDFLMAENRKFEKYDVDKEEEEQKDEEDDPFDELHDVDSTWSTVDDSWTKFEDAVDGYAIDVEAAFTHYNGCEVTMDFTDVILTVDVELYDWDVEVDALITRADGQPYIFEYCPFYY